MPMVSMITDCTKAKWMADKQIQVSVMNDSFFKGTVSAILPSHKSVKALAAVAMA